MDPGRIEEMPFETPQAQLRTRADEAFGLSSSSSAASSASFMSQVPLPYYLPASQDVRFSQPPPRAIQPRPSYGYGGQGVGYGRANFATNFAPIQEEHQGQQTPMAQYSQHQIRGPNSNMGGQGRGYGQFQQQPGGPGMGAYGSSSYNPHDGRSNDGYGQSDDGFGSQYSSNDGYYNQGPSQGYNQGPSQNFGPGRPGSAQSQWQPGYQNQSMNMTQQQYGVYQQQGYGQNSRPFSASMNSGNGRQNRGGASNYGGDARPRSRQFKDEDFLVNKCLGRRNSAGPAQQYRSSGLNNIGGGLGRGQRHNSFEQERQHIGWTNFDTRTGRPESPDHNVSGANTPRASYVQPLPAPTPRTARELGQATPTHLEKVAGREGSGPPPSFALNATVKSPTRAPRGRSNTQDPFAAVNPAPVSNLPRSLSTQANLNSDFGANGPSPHLAALAPGGVKPNIAVAFDRANMPFADTARLHPATSEAGVVRLSNIPFTVTTQEVLAFFGRNARTIPEVEEPVHIVMERVTSKTMEAFIEFVSIDEAIFTVEKFEQSRMNNQMRKLGDRHIDLEVCGQEVLMHALFPKAKNVKWVGTNPKISDHTDQWNTGFKGFVSREELVMLEKHVEHPARSPFSKKCPQRPFECLISTLNKYPWHCVDFITLADRDALHSCAVALCQYLWNSIKEGADVLHFDDRLLRRVKRAVFNCHGFSEAQKDDFAFIFSMSSIEAGLPPYAEHWSVFKAIGAKRGWAPDVVLYYIALIREATNSSALVTLAEQAAQGQQTKLASPFGNMKVEYPGNVATMTLAAVGQIEWNAIEALLRKVLPSEN